MGSVYDLDVQCDNCGVVAEPDPPENRRLWIGIGVFVLGGLGLFIGAVTGIATAGVGFVAWIVTLPLGIYFGWKSGAWMAERTVGPTCPDCGKSHY